MRKPPVPPPHLPPGLPDHPGLPLPPRPPAGMADLQDPGRQLGFLLKQTHHLLNAAIEEKMRAHGVALTFPRATALISLLGDDGLSNAQLARQALVSPQTMHQILLRLEQDGLVTRSADPAHGRVQRTALTETGRALLMRGMAVSGPVFERLQAGLDARERAELVRLLARCVGNLMDAPEAGAVPALAQRRGKRGAGAR
jgi:DNA-binding MarR family transcriptional regulator